MPEFSMKPSSQHDRQQERLVMESGDMARAVTRIAHEILERNKGVKDLGLVGIRTGGVHLAHRLVRRIHDIEGVTVPIGELDITLYRDDLALRKEQPILRKTSVPFDISGKIIVLVDDVLQWVGQSTGVAVRELALLRNGDPSEQRAHRHGDPPHREDADHRGIFVQALAPPAVHVSAEPPRLLLELPPHDVCDAVRRLRGQPRPREGARPPLDPARRPRAELLDE